MEENIKTKIDWSKYTTAKNELLDDHLMLHKEHSEKKLNVRVYSLQFSGNRHDSTGLIQFLRKSIKYFALGKKRVQQLIMDDDDPYWHALQFFGNKDPITDGKYGELILYLLTEVVLKVPMIAHKLQMLTNTNDQVKGGDGLFYGDYQGKPAILFGESKIKGVFKKALEEAFLSLDRFHDNISKSAYEFELYVARNNFNDDLSIDDLDELYKNFKPGTKEYKSNIIVHPVLIVYDEAKIKDIEIICESKLDAEEKLTQLICDKFEKYKDLVSNLKLKYPNISSVNLDFFFIPVTNVNALRYSLYEAFHGVPFRPKVEEN